MKKTLLVASLLILFCMNSCAGISDWDYSLPGGYAIWRINSSRIVIRNIDAKKDIDEISGFIKEFSYDSRYVFTRNVDSIEDNNIFREKYYIFDTEENVVYDVCNSTEELKELVLNLGIDIPVKWYRTSPDPNQTK